MWTLVCYNTATVGERIVSAYPPDGGTNQEGAPTFYAINSAFASAALQTQTASCRLRTANLCSATRVPSTAFSVETGCRQITADPDRANNPRDIRTRKRSQSDAFGADNDSERASEVATPGASSWQGTRQFRHKKFRPTGRKASGRKVKQCAGGGSAAVLNEGLNIQCKSSAVTRFAKESSSTRTSPAAIAVSSARSQSLATSESET